MALFPKYEHLFFDLDNTLWDFDRNAKLAMQQTIAELKLQNQIEDFDNFYDVYESINTELWEAYRNKEIRKSELIKKRFEDTLNHFEISGINPVAMNDLYLQIMPLQTTLVDGALETLTYLASRHFHLHIITNGFKEVQRLKLQHSNLAPFFQGIFISEEINAPKPDKRIFKHALTSSNAKKTKSIMIGDSWESDILGAKNYGIDQAYLRKKYNSTNTPPVPTTPSINKNTLPEHSTHKNTYVIEKLTDLLALI